MNRSVYAVFAFLAIAACDSSDDSQLYGYAEGRFRLLSPESAGNLVEIMVKEADVVTEGQLLASVNSRAQEAAVAEARHMLHAKEQRFADASLGAREPEVQAVREQLLQAQAQAKAASDELNRVKPLVRDGVIPQSRLDDAIAASLVADAKVAELRERVVAATLPARENILKALEAEIKAAEASVEMAEVALEKRSVVAPASGTVERLVRRIGEPSGPSQPVIRFLADSDMMAVVFVPEVKLAMAKPGAILEASCDACEPGLTATVSYVSDKAEYTAPSIFSDNERSRLVYRIEAKLEGHSPPSGTPMSFRFLDK